MREEFGGMIELLCFCGTPDQRYREKSWERCSPKDFIRINNPDNKEDEDSGWIPPDRGYQSVCRVCVSPFLANLSVAFVPFFILF